MKIIYFILFLLVSVPSSGADTQNCKITTQADLAITTVSTRVLAANAMRRSLIIQNHSPASASVNYIKFNAAHTGTEGLTVNGASTLLELIHVPTGAVYMKASPGGQSTTIIECL